MKPILLALTLAAMLSATGAQASLPANLLQNGSFEAGSWSNTTGGWMNVAIGSTAITGWAPVNHSVAWSDPSNLDGILSFDGNRSLDLTGMSNGAGGVTQTISTIAGQTYTLAFNLNRVPAFGSASVLAQAGSTSQTFSNMTSGWQAFSFNFVATGLSTSITLSNPDPTTATYYVGLDSVSVTAAVPEPETYALMLAGLGLVGFAARNKRNSNLPA